MKILYFDCFSGISGDMALSALLDLGLPEEKLREELAKLGVENYSLYVFPGQRQGIKALGVEVKVGPQKEDHRHFGDIRALIEKSSLSPEIKNLSLAIFQRVAEAEAKIHNQQIEEVHFHEVGAVDSIVDIVGVAIGIDFFRPDKIFSSELPVGRGFVNCQHGRLPLPAPATMEILKNYPVKGVSLEEELVTPTGAAIIAALSKGVSTLPNMKVEKIGYGLGKKDFPDRPNLLRLFWGEAYDLYLTDRVFILEANIDDMNPEFYGYLMEILFEAGALDVSLSHLIMKKNRPGTLLRVITQEQDLDKLIEIILRESTTLGVRFYEAQRKKLPREIVEVETKFGKVRVKVSGDLRFQPEYEDCKRIALEKGVPIQEVYKEVLKKGL
ncbi:MAG: nickel pincer cofactor biosynthesis protein LarC [Thermodesulfobacteriota bacterium]